MRHQTTGRRQRNRGNGRRGGGQHNRMQVFDSNGPDVRIRGTAHQVHEKYMALAKDAASSGDRVTAESYLQHAEHYQRVINRWESDVSGRPAGQDDDSQGDVQSRLSEGASDDLSLPASILGGSPKAENTARTRETAAAE